MSRFAYLAACLLALTACAVFSAAPGGDLAAVSPAPSLTAGPSATAFPTATPTPAPTETPVPTDTAVPSPTPTLFPMLIEALRQREYPGSDITIEKELDPGSNYRRYYASYISDGLKIYALMTIPNGSKPAGGWPVIVFNHGFIPPSVYKTTERYVAYVDTLARNGYIVFRSDYRGHDQSEGIALGAYGDPGYVDDVLSAVSSLKRYPDADPQHIGMWGHSMGGYITLRAMVVSRDIKAGVIWGGVVAPYPDLFARGPRPTPVVTGTPPPGRGGWRQWIDMFGSPEQNPAFWFGLSANNYLTDLSGPLQLHHATTDEEVPVAASQKLYDELLAAGQPAEFYTYEGDNHNLSHYFVLAMTRTVSFFDRYLKP